MLSLDWHSLTGFMVDEVSDVDGGLDDIVRLANGEKFRLGGCLDSEMYVGEEAVILVDEFDEGSLLRHRATIAKLPDGASKEKLIQGCIEMEQSLRKYGVMKSYKIAIDDEIFDAELLK
jgi:hypothetical protein